MKPIVLAVKLACAILLILGILAAYAHSEPPRHIAGASSFAALDVSS